MKHLLSIYKRAVNAVLLKSTSVVSSDYADLKIIPIKTVSVLNKAMLMKISWLVMLLRPYSLHFNLLLAKPKSYKFLFLEVTFSNQAFAFWLCALGHATSNVKIHE